MDRIASMITFVKVVQADGFASASRRLNLSPSTVTTHIQALEDRLGVRLLNRSTRNINLTDAGRVYYERCRQLLLELEEADKAVKVLQLTPSGRLTLNTSVSIPRLLAPVLAEYAGLYPNVKISLITTDHTVDLIEGGFDLAIRAAPLPDSSFIVRRIGNYRLVVCGAPDYFERHQAPRDPRDLANHNCVNFSFRASGSDWHFDGPAGHLSVQVSGNMDSNSVDSLLLAALNGQGLALLPSYVADSEIASGRLKPVLQEFLSDVRPINAIYPHRHHLSANVLSFLELAVRHCRSKLE
jgi:DNA-binding transcriptional LysR family regulator